MHCSLPVSPAHPWRQTIVQVGLQTVPRIVHFPSALAEGEGGRYAVDPSQQMQMMNKVEAEDIARFVKDRTGATVSIVRWGFGIRRSVGLGASAVLPGVVCPSKARMGSIAL